MPSSWQCSTSIATRWRPRRSDWPGQRVAGPAVEVIDPSTWALLQRLQASGMLQLVGGSARVLHQSAPQNETEAAARRLAARLAELRAQADRALRKAQVLAAGGFPEEVPALLAKAIGHAGAVRLAMLGKLAGDVSLATSAQIRELADRGALPTKAAAALEALSAESGPPTGDDLQHLQEAVADILAGGGATMNVS